MDLLLGLGLNVPTGKTDLSLRELGLITVPDLFEITTFGEGFNVNPVITLARQWGDLVLGAGLGYLWRGEYDYSYTVKNYDPGDIFTLTLEAGYTFSPGWQGRVFSEFARPGTDQVCGFDYYEEGDFRLMGAALTLVKDTWDLDCRLSRMLRDRCRFRCGNALLASEASNSHGDEWGLEVAWRYYLDRASTLTLRVGGLSIQENDYPPSSDFYFGRREKRSLGLSLARSFTPAIEGSLDLEAFTLDDERNWYHPTLNYDYRGCTAAACLNMRF